MSIRGRRVAVVTAIATATTALVLTVGITFGVIPPIRFWGPLPADDLVGTWTDARGRTLPDGTSTDGALTVATRRYAEPDCLRKAIRLIVAWPIGSTVEPDLSKPRGAASRTYVRDPDGGYRGSVAGTFDPDAELPVGAEETGFTRNGNSISIDRAGDAYVTRPDGRVERWPRLLPMTDFYC